MTTKDNSSTLIDASENMNNLQWLAKPTIAELCAADHPGLLVFPNDINKSGDKIGDDHVFSIVGDRLITGNIMGFIGYNHTKVSIRSRFAQGRKDYFLHYMLQKVFSFNIFDLNVNSDDEIIFDFLVLMFPHFLNEAMRQGLYKEYQISHYNDCHVHGQINVGRHIRNNIPFMGRIAYDTRDFSFDNSIMELIRHTIEYIQQLKIGKSVLNNSQETTSNVMMVRQATPSYRRQDRRRAIDANRRSIAHPYYHAYRDLQKLCLCILRHEELKYGKDDKEIHGILFDGAWLWEEYLNSILKHAGYKHPRNKDKTGRICLFKDGTGWRYPDFYKEGIILDAKYKGYGNRQISEIDRDDLHQVISYMWIERARHGGFIFPLRADETVGSSKTLRGYEGDLSLYGLKISREFNTFIEFCNEMEKNESVLLKSLY
jgi:5-methylcytosine-specific restriction enzyme subunit McrC